MEEKMSSAPIQEAWIIEVLRFFGEKEDEEDALDGATISIFEVPKALKVVKPEAYTPQLVAIGPYHHWREDLCTMERYKLVVAKKVHRIFSNVKFEELVEKLGTRDHRIRACYHKYLKMRGDVLYWMMAIDGLFLLQFLHVIVNKDESILAQSARMSFLADSKWKDTVLKDIMMLENQIPLFVLKRILKIQCPTKELAEVMLPQMLLGLCKEIAPLPFIKLKEDQNMDFKFFKYRAHLLDVLYHLMVPFCKESQGDIEHELLYGETEGWLPDEAHHSTKVFKDLWGKISESPLFQKLTHGPLKVVRAFGPMITGIASHVGFSFSGGGGAENEGSSNDGENKAPRVEEILIPSVTQLLDAGVEFVKTNGDISTIKFDTKTHKFYLPSVSLDVNSEVILRNLVAYEASAITDRALVLARYTELMNGIVDTAEDAKILADRKIIKSQQFNYEEVADLWNGMSKSIRLTHVDFIDKTIKDVNGFFCNTRKVRMYMAMKAYVYGSWKMLVFMATLLVLGLMFLQSFCTVYDCPRVFHFETEEK